jgi:hypothetical protein
MEEKILEEIMENITILRDRIVGSQEFKISASYFNKEDELILEKVDKIRFVEILNEQKREELWTLVSENLENYFSAHQRSITDMKDDWKSF